MLDTRDYFVGAMGDVAEEFGAEAYDIFGDLGARDIYEELDEARGANDVVFGAESKITVEDVTPPSYTSTMSPVASSPILEYGPPLSGAGSPVRYTDKATITAVQKKLAKLGYFHGAVDGIYGPVTAAAIKNYSGKDGPPDDALLSKLGLKKEIAFLDEEVDSMKVEAKTASTPAQVQVVAAKTEKLISDSPALPPELKQEAVALKQEAAQATTPAQVQVVKEKQQVLIEKVESSSKGFPAWKIAAISGGALLGVGALFGLVAFAKSR